MVLHAKAEKCQWNGLKRKRVGGMKWSGNSTDMNPIENLWKVVKNEIYSQPIALKMS